MDLRRIDENWILSYVDQLHKWLNEQDQRDRDAERRHRELAKVHAEGWKQVAGAIERGLGSIADAIRSR
ncbi:hypothetical protein ABT369_39030 [Dactylosporangium sp. NPDC000244]|uniref:hypothetical protein n=1 Tax=Dactylosporangium sp. NPDC000244 TaxID=3154365 RepID=UPI003327704E